MESSEKKKSNYVCAVATCPNPKGLTYMSKKIFDKNIEPENNAVRTAFDGCPVVKLLLKDQIDLQSLGNNYY